MTTRTYSQDYKDGFAHGRDVGIVTARIEAQPRLDALVAALQAVYADVDLANVPGGSEELNGMVCAALKPTEGPPTP